MNPLLDPKGGLSGAPLTSSAGCVSIGILMRNRGDSIVRKDWLKIVQMLMHSILKQQADGASLCLSFLSEVSIRALATGLRAPEEAQAFAELNPPYLWCPHRLEYTEQGDVSVRD